MPAGPLAFSGAAIYVNVTEQPSRLQRDIANCSRMEAGRQTWHAMQALLAISGFVFGALAAWQLAIGGGLPAGWWRWPIGHSHSRFMPTNNKLMVADAAFATSQVRQLIKTWGFLHGGKAFSPRNDAGRAR